VASLLVVSPASIGGAVRPPAPRPSPRFGGVGSLGAAVTDWAIERRKERHASNHLVSLETTLAAGLRRVDERTQLAGLE
jgi:hypothetical protein